MEKKNSLNLRLKRTEREAGFTVGFLYLGNKFVGHTLEPQWRDLHHEPKIRGDTAIPEGTYRVRLQFSPRFRCPMPYLQDVEGFDGIMIRSGDFVSESEGSILVGESFNRNMLKYSTDVFGNLYIRLFAADRAGKAMHITIKQNF